MGQVVSLLEKRGIFSDTDRSVESSVRTSNSSISSSSSSSSRSIMDSGRSLDVEKKFFLCRTVREDPNGYSSRRYYRSTVNAGVGVPFKWEAQPGKPKSSIVQDALRAAVPLSPPPSLESQKMLRAKHRRRKSRKNQGPCVGCAIFSVKNILS